MHYEPKPSALELYLMGEAAFSPSDKKKIQKSQQLFKEAIEEDERFARAHGYLSYTYTVSTIGRWKDVKSKKATLDEAEKHALMAVKLGPNDYANCWDLAFCYLHQAPYQDSTRRRNTQYDKAMAEFERARKLFHEKTANIDRKPGLLAEMGEATIYCGNPKRGVELIESALHIPDWYRWNLALGYYFLKRHQDAIDEVGRMFRKPGDDHYAFGVQLVIAAANVRLAREEKPGSSAAMVKMVDAKAAMTKFLHTTSGWTVKHEEARMPFRQKPDKEYWIEALVTAGLPHRAPPKRRRKSVRRQQQRGADSPRWNLPSRDS